MTPAPIVLFVYKRLWHLSQTVDALLKNYQAEDSEIFIFSDAAKNENENGKVSEVRNYLPKISGFKKINIILRPVHLGLANSVISGVSEIIGKYEKVIVLEDDMVTTPNFLTFMNEALDRYKQKRLIFSVTGFTYPIQIPGNYMKQVYIAYRASSWGWGTWLDRWNKADWQIEDYKNFIQDGGALSKFARGGEDLFAMLDYQMKGYIDSWAIRWCYAHFKHNAYCLYPTVSKLKNIGLDRSGTHRTKMNLEIKLDNSGRKSISLPEDIKPDAQILQNFSRYFRKSVKTKIWENMKGLIFYYLKRINKAV